MTTDRDICKEFMEKFLGAEVTDYRHNHSVHVEEPTYDIPHMIVEWSKDKTRTPNDKEKK